MGTRGSLRFALSTLAAALVALSCASASRADQMFTATGTGTDAGYGASANFKVDGSGNLVIDLKNTGTTTSIGNVNVLVGLFFDISGTNPALSGLSSATKGAGSSLVWTVNSAGQTDPLDYRSSDSTPSPAVPTHGGWDWASSTSNLPGLTQHYGLGTAGFGIFGGDTSSGGPGSPANYGIVQSAVTSYYDGLVGGGPNHDKNNTPLIKNEIEFVLTPATGVDLSKLIISNVRFQYGTDLDEPSLPGDPVNPVPEPSTMAIAALGALGFIGYGLRRRAAK